MVNKKERAATQMADPRPSGLQHQHSHCWHATRNATMIVLKDGYVHQTGCKCPETRSVHQDHAFSAFGGLS